MLITCPECGKQISSTITRCIYCGYTLVPKPAVTTIMLTSKPLKLSSLIASVICWLGLIGFIWYSQTNPVGASNHDPTLSLGFFMMTVAGLCSWLIIKVLIWWHHK